MRKYLDILITELKNQVVYIPSFMLKNTFFIIIMLVFFTLWKVIYSINSGDQILTLSQMIWYLTFTECIELSKSRIYWDVQDEVKGGSIAYSLSRPYNYNLFQISRGLGESLVKLLPLILIGFFIAFFMVGLLPDYFKILPLGFLTLVGGVILNSLWFLIIGLCSFWLEDAFPFLLVFQKIIFIFGGLFFPIEYLPDWSQPIVRILPFTFSAYWPAKVMIDFSFNKYFFVLSGQIIWIVILFFISVVIFRSAVRRLHVQGG